MNERIVLEVSGKKLHLVFGKTEQEWESYAGDENLWDVSLEDLLTGALEIDESIWYWYVDGRCYETYETTLSPGA